jgi:hypothetical protein
MLTGGAAGSTEVFYDWGKIRIASEELSGYLNTFKGDVETLYNDVATLGNYWSGPSYNAFKTNCENYKKNSIDPLIGKISNWVTKLEALAAEAEGTSKANTQLFS